MNQTKQTVIEKLRRIIQRGKRISPRITQALELIDLLEAEPPERWDLIRFLGIAGQHFDPEILRLGAFQIPEHSTLTPATAAMHTLQEYLGAIPTKAEIGVGKPVSPHLLTLMTSQQAADYLEVSRTAVLNWARSGALPCVWESGKRRFDQADLDAFRETLPRPRGRKQR